MDLPETSELQAFVRIVQAGSLSGASQELAVPRATLSRRLARLEERLGVRLVHRTTRRLHLTDAGEAFYPQARDVVGAVQAASDAVALHSQSEPTGLLRVSVPPLTQHGPRALLLDFLERYPKVELEVSSSTRHEDLLAGHIDVAWRAGVRLDPGLVARKLTRTDVVAVASPAYLARRGTPQSVDELVHHTLLLGFDRGVRAATRWPLRDGGHVAVQGRLVSNQLSLLHDAVVRGLGIAMLPAAWEGDTSDTGDALVPVLPTVLGASSQVALVYPNRRLLKPAARAFVDFVVERMAQDPLWRTAPTPAASP